MTTQRLPRLYSICDTGGYFFHHFILELSLLRHLTKNEGDDCIYIHFPHLKKYNEKYMIDSLKFFEPEIKHVDATNLSNYEIINIGNHEPLITKERNQVEQSAILYLRKIFTRNIEPSYVENKKYIYISRNGKNRRELLNENELIPKLELLGFKIVKLEEESLEEKLDIFGTASIIISPGGGGLSLIFAANKKTKIIEIIYDNPYVKNFYIIAKDIGHPNYESYTNVNIIEGADVISHNMRIDVDAFICKIKQIIQEEENTLT